MKDLEHASINGIEIHDLIEQEDEETLFYSGELWMDGRGVGSFTETESGMELDVSGKDEDELNRRVESYLKAVSAEGYEEDGDDGEEKEEIDLSEDVFFEDLIELELYLRAYKEGVKEGYNCLLVNYTKDAVDVYSVESEDEVENIARENNLTNFQTFSEPEHFIVNC